MNPFRRRQPLPAEREVRVLYHEYWGDYLALVFTAPGDDDSVLGVVNRVAHPFDWPRDEKEAAMRRELVAENRTLCHGDTVTIGGTAYQLTENGWAKA